MTPEEEFLQIKTGEEFNAFNKKYKGQNIKYTKKMIEHFEELFRRICPNSISVDQGTMRKRKK